MIEAANAGQVRGLSDDCVVRANPAADGGSLLRRRGPRLPGAAQLPRRRPASAGSRAPGRASPRDAGAARPASDAAPRCAPRATAAPPVSACSPPVTARPAPAQDLKRIRQIDAELEAGLNKLGVHRYEQIAAWMQPDVKRIERGARPRGPHQPGELDRAGAGAGQGRRHPLRHARGPRRDRQCRADARRRRAAHLAPAAASSAGSRSTPARLDRRRRRGGRRGRDGRTGARLAAADARARTPPDVSGRAAFAAPRRAGARAPAPQAASAPRCPAPAVPIRPAAPAARDNLQRISGIDARGREAADRAGRHPLLADRALVAGRRGALRRPARREPGASAARTGSSRRRS